MRDVLRRVMFLTVFCILAAMGINSCAWAEPLTQGEDRQKAPANGTPSVVLSRFNFQRVDDGLLRMDEETGKVALCSPHKGGWSCEAVPENRVAAEKEAKLENENAELRAEVMRLKTELAELRAAKEALPQSPPQLAPLAPPIPPANLNPPSNDEGFKLRIDRNIERLRVNVERWRVAIGNVWHQVMNLIASLRNDIMHKAPPDQAASG